MGFSSVVLVTVWCRLELGSVFFKQKTPYEMRISDWSADVGSSDLIRLAFGLTPAEARLAAQLKRGFALKEAAQALEISVNTARNQLKSIFDKQIGRE